MSTEIEHIEKMKLEISQFFADGHAVNNTQLGIRMRAAEYEIEQAQKTLNTCKARGKK